jgi:hypothetical protein
MSIESMAFSIRPKKGDGADPMTTAPLSATLADDAESRISGAQTTIIAKPCGCPSAVVAVSERGDAEVTLEGALSVLKLDESGDRRATESTRDHQEVVLAFVTPEKEKCLILESIHSEENGLELFLETSASLPAYDSTNNCRRPHLADVALLDLDASTSCYESPVKPGNNGSFSSAASPGRMGLVLGDFSTPDKVPSYCGLLVCGDDDCAPLSPLTIQAKITQFLSSPVTSTIGGGWQRAWGLEEEEEGDGGRISSNEKKSTCSDVHHHDFEAEILELQRRLQRALVHRIHTKKSMHIDKLRRNAQPFLSCAQSRSKDLLLSQRRVRSFQDNAAISANRRGSASEMQASHATRGASSSVPELSGRGKILVDHVFPLWTCGMNCGTLTDDEVSPVVKSRKRPESRDDVSNRLQPRFDPDEDGCYDSDPETFAVTKLRVYDNKENIPPNLATNRQRESPVCQIKHTDRSLDLAQEMFNERFTLVVHHHTLSTQKNSTRAMGVHAFLERGQQLKAQVLPPRLVWIPIHSELERSPSMRSLIHSVSLLDIVRILEGERVVSDGLKPQNLAKTTHTLFVQTLDDSFLIEAENRRERDRFVHGLKVVVARLGSFLLCRDDRLLDEFFLVGSLGSTGMVGHEPFDYLLQDGDDHDAETIYI